uniref:Uncharacterized protein n=1 Tax=Rhizophora mucronata TaxID=61149 RepID=A0A2P2PAN5_RHIMU
MLTVRIDAIDFVLSAELTNHIQELENKEALASGNSKAERRSRVLPLLEHQRLLRLLIPLRVLLRRPRNFLVAELHIHRCGRRVKRREKRNRGVAEGRLRGGSWIDLQGVRPAPLQSAGLLPSPYHCRAAAAAAATVPRLARHS